MLKFNTSCAVLAYLSSNLLNEVGLSLFRYFEVGLRVCDIVVKKFTFAISSPDEFLLHLVAAIFVGPLFGGYTFVGECWPSRLCGNCRQGRGFLISHAKATPPYAVWNQRHSMLIQPRNREFVIFTPSLGVIPCEYPHR